MNPAQAAERLSASARAIEALARGLDPEDARWRPAADRWSAVEILAHLLDEEREDFRVRLEYTLERPDEPFPTIDPEGWCEARRYRERDAGEVLDGWSAERERSLAWLRGLGAIDLSLQHDTAWGRPIAAGDLLGAWVAHDLLHLRQLTGVLHARLAAEVSPYGLDYAGSW